MEHSLGECRKDSSLVGVWVMVVLVRCKRYCMSERSSAGELAHKCNRYANISLLSPSFQYVSVLKESMHPFSLSVSPIVFLSIWV